MLLVRKPINFRQPLAPSKREFIVSQCTGVLCPSHQASLATAKDEVNVFLTRVPLIVVLTTRSFAAFTAAYIIILPFAVFGVWALVFALCNEERCLLSRA
jgi:hypothetical protein